MRNEMPVQKFRSIEEMNNAREPFSPFSFALVYAGLGHNDLAVQWLEQSYQSRAFADVGYIKVDPQFDSLRSDPHFAALLRTLEFRP
jgi:hypothetical protein